MRMVAEKAQAEPAVPIIAIWLILMAPVIVVMIKVAVGTIHTAAAPAEPVVAAAAVIQLLISVAVEPAVAAVAVVPAAEQDIEKDKQT